MNTPDSAGRFLFVRTFKPLKGGGPVPPLGVLYLASSIRQRFGARFKLLLMDTGNAAVDACLEEMRRFSPDFVGISSMSCEDDLLHAFARAAKEQRPDTVVIAGGPHPSILRERLLEDDHIDYSVIGEGERTLVELVDVLLCGGNADRVAGMALRTVTGRIATPDRPVIEDLDSLPFPAWDLVNLDDYTKSPTWAGALREKLYAPVITSRGCPYGCIFCHSLFGRKVRRRSPANVIDEITGLHRTYGVREIHFIDDIFNSDQAVASEISRLLIQSGMNLSIAFPNGLRADIMTDELLDLLRRAGAYKINYGVETTSERLQNSMGKRLDLQKTRRTIERTSRAGIITGAYFMLGLPSQTSLEINETIDYAAKSDLDVAYFFKAIPYPGSVLHQNLAGDRPDTSTGGFNDLHFYAANLSFGTMEAPELNRMLLHAQRRFYLSPRRMWRGLWKAPHKLAYLRNMVNLFVVLLQANLFEALIQSAKRSGR